MKVVSIVSQLVLARLLVPEVFGLFALVLSILTFADITQRSGIREILIRRQGEFPTLANPAFWLSTALGIGGAVVVLVAAPLLSQAYRESDLMPALLAVSLGVVFTAAAQVPRAKLFIEFRFRYIALMQMGVGILRFGSSIVLAYLGFGLWALVVPLVAGQFLMFLMVLIAARTPIRPDPCVRQWGTLVRDMSVLLLAGFITAIMAQGDYLILRFFDTTENVGIYYMAFMLSVQPILMFSLNIGNVLMPTLSSIQDDPARQVRGFLKAARALALMVAPLCLIQAALAAPLVRVIFPKAFYDAALPLAILCLGMSFRTITGSSMQLINAQGRFRMRLALQAIIAVPFFIGAIVGAWLGGMNGMAIGVSVPYVLSGFLVPYVGIRLGGAGLKDVAMIHTPAIGLGAIAGVVAFVPGWFLPDTFTGHLVHLATGGLAGVLVYVGLARLLLPRTWKDITTRIYPLFARVGRFLPIAYNKRA